MAASRRAILTSSRWRSPSNAAKEESALIAAPSVSLLGAFLMSVLANGCTLSGVPNYVQEILIGAIIVAAVALDRLRQRAAP